MASLAFAHLHEKIPDRLLKKILLHQAFPSRIRSVIIRLVCTKLKSQFWSKKSPDTLPDNAERHRQQGIDHLDGFQVKLTQTPP